MTTEQEARWVKVRHFPIGSSSEGVFVKRLAKEQGWTPVFAARVVEEYRRFALLATTGSEGTTPSKAVDEAWHLHLLFTRNYWDDFCPNALGRQLHHEPADGSPHDESKYREWYATTLRRYEEAFGEEPPEDIWPRAARSKKRVAIWPWAALSLLLLAGCTEPTNPLDWAGPDFLQLFAAVGLGALLIAWVAKLFLSLPASGPPAGDWQLDPYEIAYLNGGPRLALAACVANLSASKYISCSYRRLGINQGAVATDLKHPLDTAVFGSAVGGASAPILKQSTGNVLAEMGENLRKQGLWVSRSTATTATLISALIVLSVLGLGIAKMIIGVSRGRPIELLAFESVIFALLSIIVLIPPKRSRYGSKVLSTYRDQRSAFRRVGNHPDAQPQDYALAVALFGFGALAGSAYTGVRTYFAPDTSSSGSSYNSSCSSGSSCGSSGCGGGGSGCGGCSSG